MIHKKQFNSMELAIPNGELIIEGSVTPQALSTYQFHHNLTAFRPANEQHAALIEIAELPDGRIIVARDRDTIIGYVTYLYPDPLESWSDGNMENLIELGAIEVAHEYRGYQVGKNLIRLSMLDDSMEDYIIITTEYYWHWDLKGTGLDVWKYRKIMEKMMGAGGLEVYSTDDPEICSHPANCLLARIGSRINADDVEKFNRLRFRHKGLF